MLNPCGFSPESSEVRKPYSFEPSCSDDVCQVLELNIHYLTYLGAGPSVLSGNLINNFLFYALSGFFHEPTGF